MKALRTAAFVIGAVALVATGVGALGTAGLLGSAIASGGAVAGIATAATLTTVGAIAGAASAVLSLAAGKPKGSVGGNATQFKIDKDAGLPIIIGRTYSGGNVVHRQYYGAKNSLESWVTVHSIGPVRSLGPLLINKVAVALTGAAVGGSYAGWMWLDQQLGACPEVSAMAGPQGNFPGWGPNHNLSGLAADLWTLKFDEKMKVYPNGVPQRGRIVEGVYVYDPRLDSTYPGGSGACRIDQPATHVWSECPALHAIIWAYGHMQNGVLVAGGGLKVTGIDLAPFVDWANVCDANAWKAGGIVYTTSDNSWDVLVMIAQAGGAEVFPVGAQLSCSFNAPRVSIGTITSNDIAGDIDVPGTASRRLRRNTVIPRVRLESHGWEEVPLDAIAIPAYVAADGGSRPTEVAFPLVQQVDQGAQLGLYAMWNGRELDGIVLPAKVYAIGYRPGDCLTVDIPEAALVGRDVIVRNREIEGSTMAVTLTCRSETAAKHPFCLGKTGNAPPTPDLSIPPSFAVSNHPAYELLDQNLSYPFSSDDNSITITPFSAVVRDGIGSIDFPAGSVTGLAGGTSYTLFWTLGAHDEPLTDETGTAITDQAGVVITAPTAAGQYVAYPTPALSQQQSSDFVYLRKISTLLNGQAPPSETPPPGDGGNGSGGGGNCVTVDSLLMMADSSWKRAGDLKRGDRVRTQHEATLAWGDFTVSAVSIAREEIMRAPGHPDATPMHRFWHDGWTQMRAIGEPAGWGDVARITVAGAHTYVARHPGVAEGVLSHNLKQQESNAA